jgi:hypothetical protein
MPGYPDDQQPAVGAWELDTILPADPVAGAVVTQTVPAEERWTVDGVGVVLATSATVVDRLVQVSSNSPGNIRQVITSAPLVQGAGTTRTYYFARGGPTIAAVLAGWVVASLAETSLDPGWRLVIDAVNLQVGDDFAPALVGFRRST